MYDGYRCRVFKRLVTPRWLGALLLAALFAAACYHLGWWQYDRHLAKAERNERLDEHYRATPVPLSQVLTAPVPIADYDVPQRADQDDYLGAANDWHDAIAKAWADSIVP